MHQQLFLLIPKEKQMIYCLKDKWKFQCKYYMVTFHKNKEKLPLKDLEKDNFYVLSQLT